MSPYRKPIEDTRTQPSDVATERTRARTTMIDDIVKAVEQLADRRSRGQVLTAIGAALTVLIVLVVVLWQVLQVFTATGYGWLDGFIQGAGILAASFIAWIAFPFAVSTTLGFFADDLCDAVEAKHYPSLPPARHQPLSETLVESLGFAGLAILLNIAVLPLYLMPGPNIVIYLALNGWLLGREYFDVVAMRRAAPGEVAKLRSRLRAGIWISGVIIAFSLTIPIVNLVAPLLGVAFMTHRYHRLLTPPEINQ